MAWTSPATFVDGQIPTASDFNTQFRDNLNELALHAHTGGSGSGTAELGPILNATLADDTPPGSAGGTLTRIYTTVGTFGWVSPSGSAYLAANSTHEHTGSWIASTGTTTATQGSILNMGASFGATLTSAMVGYGSIGYTIGGSGSRAVSVFAAFQLRGGTDEARDIAIRVVRTFIGTGTLTVASASIRNTTTLGRYVVFTPVATALASGSYQWEVQASATASSNVNPTAFNSIFGVSEFQIK